MLNSLTLLKLQKAPDYVSTFIKHGSLGNHPILRLVPASLKLKVLDRIALGRKDGFCYFRVPKAANSTIVRSLFQNSRHHNSDGVDGITAKRILHGIPSQRELEKMFVFTFVRHPVSRTLSAFLDKSRDENFRSKYPCMRVEPGTPEGFAGFLNQLADGQLYDNIHWAPQTSILPYDLAKYSFVGKFENLEADLSHCLAEIFGVDTHSHSHTPNRTGASEAVASFVGKRERRIIETLFKQDFEQFYPGG